MTLIPSAYDYQIALQSAKGTPATNPSNFLLCLDGSDISADPEIVTIKTGEGTRMADGISFVAGAPVAGNLICVCQDNMLPLLLIAGMGNMVVSGGTDPYSHTATVAQSAGVPYITVFKHVSGHYEVFPDCKLNTLRLETSHDGENQIMRATLGIMGIGLPIFRTAEPAIPATAEDKDHIFSWSQAAGTWEIDSETIAGISEFILEINNNLAMVPGETKTGYMLWEQLCEVSATSRLVIEDWARYNNFMYGSDEPTDETELSVDAVPTGSLAVTFTRVAAAPGPERSFSVAIPELRYALGDKPKVVGDPKGEPIYQSMGGLAIGTDPKITCVVKNGVASYAEETS